MEEIIENKSILERKPSNYDNLELQIRKEQAEYKADLLPNFISEINNILELAFMLPKERKENFITKEKIKLTLFKLIRKQKKFKSPENIFGDIRYLAVYDKESNEIGKLKNLDMINQTASFITYNDRLNNRQDKIKSWKDIYLFDFNSSQLEVMYNHYHKNNQNELSFVEMVQFLELNNFTKIRSKEKEDFGKELEKAEEHPIMKEIMIEYKIPEKEIKKVKKTLQKLDKNNEVLEEFASVTDAEEKLNISASTISNVLCQGNSALKYLEAGGFRWQYSDKPNLKYSQIN